MKTKSCIIVLAWLMTLLPAMLRAQVIDASGSHFVIHASGNHLANASDKAVLEAADAPGAAPLVFTPDGNGYYTIADANGKFLALSGSWNLVFGTDASSAKALFSVEKANGSYVKIKCKSNNKYIGTDDITAGASVFSDKNGNDSRHHWFLADKADAPLPVVSYAYVINPAAERQKYDGWGVSLCWWANMCGKWDEDKIDEIVDWLVSPEGLNYRIFRYNIGGGDDPENRNCTAHHMGKGKGLRAEMEGFKDSSDGEYIWTRDEAQRKIMLKIKEKRPDAIFEAFSNSAPWYMTYSGCCAGNTDASKDNLRPEYYEEFAHYLVDVCKHYKEVYGIEFKTLEPFNEPMTSYWGANGGQEGCHFDVASQIAFLKVLDPILKASGLKTVISASDETSVEQSVKDFSAYRKDGVLGLVGQWNVHTYTANNKARARISALCEEEAMPLWMSEVGAGGSGITGNLNLAQKLIDDIRYIMPSAWVDWQYIEENNDQWCLVQSTSKFEDQQYRRVKNYYIRQQFSKFIGEGHVFLTTLSPQTLAARNADGSLLTIVTINPAANSAEYTADLSMFATVGAPETAVRTSPTEDMAPTDAYTLTDGILRYTMPGQSIVTFVIPVSAGPVEPAGTLKDGENYLVAPRMAADVVLDTDNGAVKIRSTRMDVAQLWTLTAAEGGFKLTNGNNETISRIGDEYALKALDTAADGQVFDIRPVGRYFFKICEPEGERAFDLEGENTGNGTGVGLWKYDDNEAPTHRHWAFIHLPKGGLTGIDTPVADGGAGMDAAPLRLTVADGALTAADPEDRKGIVQIHTASGICAYSRVLGTEGLTIPLTTGYYVVSYLLPSGAWSQAVIVR